MSEAAKAARRPALPRDGQDGVANGNQIRSFVLPLLPHDAIERAAAVEALAVEIVRQVGSVVALTIASALDEVVADAQR